MKTILIVNAERQRKKDLITHLAKRWEMMGFQVIMHYGSNNLPPADIAVLHVNRTVVPQIYHDVLADYPIVINRNILDISRERYSNILLTDQSNYKGAVIIKTNANYGGIPEYNQLEEQLRLPQDDNWSTKEVLDPKRYPIYRRLQDVPHGSWENPHLIIEKFVPEIERKYFFRKYYFVRYWSFFGDSSLTGRFGSRNPILKFSSRETEDIPVEIPASLVEKRRELEIDYGRFDFVVHNNRAILLDVNKTLGGGPALKKYGDFLDNLAQGINSFVS